MEVGRCKMCGLKVERGGERRFDWDHTGEGRTAKIGEVSTLITRGKSWDRIQTEIDKSRLLCSYYHQLYAPGSRKKG